MQMRMDDVLWLVVSKIWMNMFICAFDDAVNNGMHGRPQHVSLYQ